MRWDVSLLENDTIDISHWPLRHGGFWFYHAGGPIHCVFWPTQSSDQAYKAVQDGRFGLFEVRKDQDPLRRSLLLTRFRHGDGLFDRPSGRPKLRPIAFLG